MDRLRQFFCGSNKDDPVPCDDGEEDLAKFLEQLQYDEIENLEKEFTHPVKNSHDFLQDVLRLEQHFQNVTDTFKEFLRQQEFWHKWQAYAAKILNLLSRTNQSTITDDISNLDEFMANSANTIMTLLELKQNLKFLFHVGLNYSFRTEEDEIYLMIKRFFIDGLSVIDTLVTAEMEKFLRHKFPLGNVMNKELVEKLMDTLDEYESEISNNLYFNSMVNIYNLHMKLRDLVS